MDIESMRGKGQDHRNRVSNESSGHSYLQRLFQKCFFFFLFATKEEEASPYKPPAHPTTIDIILIDPSPYFVSKSIDLLAEKQGRRWKLGECDYDKPLLTLLRIV